MKFRFTNSDAANNSDYRILTALVNERMYGLNTHAPFYKRLNKLGDKLENRRALTTIDRDTVNLSDELWTVLEHLKDKEAGDINLNTALANLERMEDEDVLDILSGTVMDTDEKPADYVKIIKKLILEFVTLAASLPVTTTLNDLV